MAMRGPRHPIGAAPWVQEERTTALQIAQSEVEEFMFSAKNEMDWLNEHMADIFSENQINVADIFKTPGKLRGKTPRTARKVNKGDIRAPLTDVFSSTPKGAPNPFAVSKLTTNQQQQRRQSPTFTVAEDKPTVAPRKSQSPSRAAHAKSVVTKTTKVPQKTATDMKPEDAVQNAKKVPVVTKPAMPASSLVDSGYHGSQSQDDDEDELAGGMATQPLPTATRSVTTPEAIPRKPVPTKSVKQKAPAPNPVAMSPDEMADRRSLTQPTMEPSYHSAKEEQTEQTENAEQAEQIEAAVISAPEPAPEAGQFTAVPVDETLSSSPFCPVQSPSSSPLSLPPSFPVRDEVVSSPPKTLTASSAPKPVLAPSSPLQSTTPACPPPRGLLSALGLSSGDAASSPVPNAFQVPPTVPTPPRAAVPVFISAKRVAVAALTMDNTKDVEGIECADEVSQEEEMDDEEEEEEEEGGDELDEAERQLHSEETARSPSHVPSPARPIVRKSSINFASLPAREPFTSKSTATPGVGLSRASHMDAARVSYYNRPTGGKSLGNVRSTERDKEEDNSNDMAIDGEENAHMEEDMVMHNKTYAQRLHDRISMLGKSQASAPRPSKSLAALAQQHDSQLVSQQKPAQQKQHQQEWLSPKRSTTPVAGPGAFPADEEVDDTDDWFIPSSVPRTAGPRPGTAKSLIQTAVAEESTSLNNPGDLVLVKNPHPDASRHAPPQRIHVRAPAIPERTTSAAVPGHMKSASVPSLPVSDPTMLAATKQISVSNPTNVPVHTAVLGLDNRPATPSKSPSHINRDSPLKHVKNKLSSILKTSKGLLASSAALSAEGKSSLLSPSSMRLGLAAGASMESLTIKAHIQDASEAIRSNQSRQPSAETAAPAASVLSEARDIHPPQESPSRPASPTRPIRRTRASIERERREMKQREKEMKEVQRMADQMGKLEKIREKEREKARVFVEEQEKAVHTLPRPVQSPGQRTLRDHKHSQQEYREEASQEEERQNEDDEDMAIDRQPSPPRPKLKPQSSSPIRSPEKPTRSSPRKAKAPQAHTDVDMDDATTSMPPPPPPHGTTSNASVPRSAQSTRTIRRPVKPIKDAQAKPKQAPTVIRVNTSSSQHQQHQPPQFHPSNAALAASLHETLVGSAHPQPSHSYQLKNKASTTSLHAKPSLQSLKSSVSSTGRPKALDLAAKRKEAEEREAQRKRDAKAEIERKRAALQEQEEQRKIELQKQKEREREHANAEAAAAKRGTAAQRQAAIERAKQTRAPPPAQRTPLPSGPSAEYNRIDAQPPRPQSRLATATGSAMHRSHDELQRPVNAVLSHTGKSLSKRPLPGADAGHESQSHGAYQQKDAKRIRMSEEFDEDELEMGGHVPRVSSIKGPPVRPSGGFKKDFTSKSVFGNGYSTAPANVSRDLFKATVTAQHNHQARTGHPLDLGQVSKAAISFAPTGSNTVSAAAAAAAASGSAAPAPSHNQHKTPLRPVGVPLAGKSTAKSAKSTVAKSAAKSSPRFPNGDGIELPEIQTDDEDSDEDEQVNVAPWADSPDLRRALMRQETVDPFQVFGPPGPLNMEEVFNKTKDRWHKFRARTSSANWSGADRLTDEDIRKDLAARDKIRREGGWSYDLAGV